MKIISFAADKGGVGKTTLTYNYGEWLANQGKKVLLVDLDQQCNLSQTYDVMDLKTNVGNIFSGKGETNIHQVKQNLSLIAGNMHLDDIQASIQTNPNKNMLLYMWMYDHVKEINQFDFILFDCHPDFSIATKNAIIVSNDVISPIIPSEYGFTSKFDMESRFEALKKEAIDFTTRKSYVTAKLYFLENMIENNTNASREFQKALKQDKTIVAIIPKKQLFVRSTLDKKPISEMNKDHVLYVKQRKFFDYINNVFANISAVA